MKKLLLGLVILLSMSGISQNHVYVTTRLSLDYKEVMEGIVITEVYNWKIIISSEGEELVGDIIDEQLTEDYSAYTIQAKNGLIDVIITEIDGIGIITLTNFDENGESVSTLILYE